MTTDLITRIESAGPEDQSKLVWEAFRRLDHEAPPARYSRFKALHDAEAYLDAALMLVPGVTWVIDCATQTTEYMQPVAHVWTDRGKFTGKARAPALALLAAILKAGEAA